MYRDVKYSVSFGTVLSSITVSVGSMILSSAVKNNEDFQEALTSPFSFPDWVPQDYHLFHALTITSARKS